MAQYGSGQMQMQGPQMGLCDYCHQKPRFPPYNYCGKACGSKAKASGGVPSNGPAICKQCGQRPVHKGHEFCGRNCANTWQGMYGHINTGGYSQPQHVQQSWNPMPPPHQTQNPHNNQTQPFQGFSQGGGLKGIVMGIKGLVSQGQQPQPSQVPQQQQQLGPQNYSHMQQIPGQISPNPSMMISPPITPSSSGMGSPMSTGMGGPMPPGAYGQMSSGTSSPTTPGYYSPASPTNPGIQDPNANGQANGHHFTPPPKMYSTSGTPQPNHDPNDLDSYPDPNQDPTANSFPGHAQNPGGVQAHVTSHPVGDGGHGGGNGNWVLNNPNYPHSQSLGLPTTCLLNGCGKPVFVDPVTHHPSDYCSKRHREDAALFGQVNPCIMCLKRPRGPNDHFCSRACREKALSP